MTCGSRIHVASTEFSEGGQVMAASKVQNSTTYMSRALVGFLNGLFIWPLQHGVSRYYMAAQNSQTKGSKIPE